ncbi:MAG: type II toxin-antitoxin system prevent-host-death family antitoxin [Dehalococcoidia bacterium]
MYSVGIRDLKDKLSSYLNYARQGESIIVTDRGKPIAIIHPIDDQAVLPSEITLARLAAEGIIRLSRSEQRENFPLVKVSGPSVSGAVIEDRR